MPRIAWIEDSEARGQLAELFDIARSHSQRRGVPDIVRTMSQRPDFLSAIMDAARCLHFSDGALTRAQHEMIASYVSALNRCHY
jgi:hypothetical protein